MRRNRRSGIVIASVSVVAIAWILYEASNGAPEDESSVLQVDAVSPSRTESQQSDSTEVIRSTTASDSLEIPIATELEAESVENAESCAEAERRGLRFAEGRGADEAACSVALNLFFGPRVPALPGLAGFDVSDAGAGSPRDRLFQESDNPDWSRGMEGRILSESSNIVDFPLITLHAVCRSSTCGVLFAYADAAFHGGSYNHYAQQFADTFGFSGFHAGSTRGNNGIGYTYIYLGTWKTPRPGE